MTPAPLTHYSDYRAVLADYLARKRAAARGFTVRQFCLKAGVSTENYLLRVLRGQRNLGPGLAARFAAAMGLKGRDAKYFVTLVLAESARTLADREMYLGELEELRRRIGPEETPGAKTPAATPGRESGHVFKAPLLTRDNLMMRHWYLGAIWELASLKDFDLTAQSAADILRPRVSVQQAKEAIEFLLERGYLARKNGRLGQNVESLSSTDGVPDAIVRLNHKETVQAAIDAIELPIEERGFFGLTLAFNQKRLPEVKSRMRAFLEGLRAELAHDGEADGVYRVQTQCIPLTDRRQ